MSAARKTVAQEQNMILSLWEKVVADHDLIVAGKAPTISFSFTASLD